MQLDWWKPDVGCLRVEHCVRVLGLPLHLWGEEFFKKFSDVCRGFLAVDEEMRERQML